jgi:hypothetical protein
MSSERIEQCRQDIAKLQEELKRLERENETTKLPQNGDIVAFGRDRELRIIICDRRGGGLTAYDRAGYEIITGRTAIENRYQAGLYIRIGNVFALGQGLVKGV